MIEPRLGSSGRFKECATLAAAEAYLVVDASGGGQSIGIQCGTAGTLVVKQAYDGESQTLTFAANERKDIACIAIVEAGSSGCIPVTVYR